MGVSPGEWGEAHFFGAETVEELLFGPAGFAGDLREEAARAVAETKVDAVVQHIEIENVLGGLKGGEDGNFQVQLGEFGEGDGIGDETRVFQDALGTGADGFEKGVLGLEPADAAAELVGVMVVEGDETAGGLREEGIRRGNRPAR